ncbi:MAG: hypothetical protein KDG55_07930 [Rhodocyclaceae bacterium]|nr:hypothetical protein [Rhodocyclaceae bacterium]
MAQVIVARTLSTKSTQFFQQQAPQPLGVSLALRVAMTVQDSQNGLVEARQWFLFLHGFLLRAN